MGFSNQNPEDFVDHYYSREAYELCYREAFLVVFVL
jgi:hypothetical protein